MQHVKTVHEKSDISRETVISNYKCKTCGKTFKEKEDCEEHIKFIHKFSSAQVLVHEGVKNETRENNFNIKSLYEVYLEQKTESELPILNSNSENEMDVKPELPILQSNSENEIEVKPNSPNLHSNSENEIVVKSEIFEEISIEEHCFNNEDINSVQENQKCEIAQTKYVHEEMKNNNFDPNEVKNVHEDQNDENIIHIEVKEESIIQIKYEKFENNDFDEINEIGDPLEIDSNFCQNDTESDNITEKFELIQHSKNLTVNPVMIDSNTPNVSTNKNNCEFCEESFKSKEILRNHIITIHKEENDHCKICGKKVFDAELHNKIFHGNKKTYKCDLCGETFARSVYLKTHINDVHNTTQIEIVID